MSKTLGKVALVVGAVALVATGVGAVAGAVGAAKVLGVATATLVKVGTIASVASSVLSVAANLTAKKPSAQASGSQTNFSADPDAPIPWVLGRTGTAGNIVFRQGFDTADAGTNDRQAFVSVLSLGPVAEIEGQTVDRSPVSYLNGAAVGAFAGFMWMTTQLGALSGPALAFGTGAGTPPGWTADHKLSGLAAASWTLRFDTKAKLFQAGVPAPMWVVRGALCYDPRKDSTYPGGSGPHRMADPANRAAYDAAVATWEWSENPYLLGLRWAHGVWQRDVSDPSSNWTRVIGMGAPAAAIDTAAFVEGANVADANGWTCGGVAYSADDKWDTLKKILQAGMGEPLPLGAKVSCIVNAPKVSLATITTADVRGDVSVTATQPRRDRINSLTPRFRTEANAWRLLPAAPITVAAHVATDGGKRSRTVDYAFIQDAGQAGTAARYDIENAREFGPVVLPLGLAWMGYKPGDCVTVTAPEVGLNAQPILLLNRGLEPTTGIVTLTGRSETFGKHAFALGQTATPPSTPALTGPALIPTPGAGAWNLAALSGGIPGLVVTGAVDAGTADAVVFEVRPFVNGQAADANWTGAGVEAATVTRKEIAPLAQQAPFEVAVGYRVREFTGARRIIGPITTGALATTVDAVARQTATDAQTAANTAIGRVNALGDDGRLTGVEKKQLETDDAELDAAWAVLDARAAIVGAPVATARSEAATARSSWVNYRNGLSPAWNDETQDTIINRATFRATLVAYSAKIDALADALRAVAAADATAALTRVTRLGSDGWLTAGKEKQDARIAFEAILDELAALVARHDALGQPSDSIDERTAAGAAVYAGQPNSLGTYLATLDLSGNTDTAVDPATWEARWGAAYQALAAFQAAMIGGAEVDIQEVLEAIDATITDNEWTRQEKIEVLIPRDAELEALWNLLSAKADAITGSSVVTTARNEAATARSDWQAYRNGVSPAWNDTTQATPITRTTARARLVAYTTKLDALAEALRVYVDVRATTALDRVTAIANDNVLAKEEKFQYDLLWTTIIKERDRTNDAFIRQGGHGGTLPQSVKDAQLAAFNATEPGGSYPATSLGNYLGSLSPTWNDSSVDTPIDGTTFKLRFRTGQEAVAAFVSSMLGRPDADNTVATINSGSANGAIDTRVNASPKLSQLDTSGRATSRRINTPYTVAGAQQVYIPTVGNTNVGGTVAADVPGSPIWAYAAGDGTATIQVLPHKLIDDAGTTFYANGFNFGAAMSTQYWVVDTSGYGGGSTYLYLTNAELLNNPNYRLVGAVVTPPPSTPASQGVSGGGGGGGGIRERFYENQRTEVPV